MMRKMLLLAVAGLVVGALSATGNAQQISGDYVETRSADVWTGPCFANAEVGLVGNQAILAWHVKKGEWDGSNLEGLSVVGVVKASHTLGDPFENALPAKAVMIVDQRATTEQRAALIKFAQAMTGDLLKNTVEIQYAPIQVDIDNESGHYGKVSVKAGTIAGIETRSLSSKDHLCGNEEVYYPPLANMSHSMPAVATMDRYTGPGLNVSWTVSGKRSAFVGSFSKDAPAEVLP